MEEISLVYYGYVFDASGYGNAARSYIHAMHEAGLQLSVVDLARHGHQVHDELVESLQRRPLEADFHLFHGIPPQWARMAFRQPRGIGMTVWETDMMPTQWRNALNQMLEVWLPCEFNVDAFGKALDRPVFRLPHPMGAVFSNGFHGTADHLDGVSPDDFLFYSIFEWQDRKCPHELISAFLRAFSSVDQACLVIKTNPGAAGVAHAALDAARKATRSDARVLLYPQGWSDSQIAALHGRGDCYVSLHRGEGWNCPLFDATCKGKPVIATGYSGPMDYLNPQDHLLVRYKNCSVKQPYLYYHPAMQWADPDVSHASELMRWAFEHPEESRAMAQRAAPAIRESYSAQSVGQLAKTRLMALLRRTRPERWRQLPKTQRNAALMPPHPIPGEWYDGDYFETGLKSNWTNGYAWPAFSGLFRDAARFLISIFPDAHSFLDVGCAKGFLVRSLREEGKEAWGLDFSPWAIRNAERSCASFLQLASVDEYPFDRECDVLVAFSILESMTESQIHDFLTRSRLCTRMAIFAVISCFEETDDRQAMEKEDNDLSHITMRTRAWWHDAFLQSGWSQGPSEESIGGQCLGDSLPSRMRWKAYIYAPR